MLDKPQVRCTEAYETFFSHVARRELVEYNYRASNGLLFVCIRSSVRAARAACRDWLENQDLPTTEIP